jgi:hypothetical protein
VQRCTYRDGADEVEWLLHRCHALHAPDPYRVIPAGDGNGAAVGSTAVATPNPVGVVGERLATGPVIVLADASRPPMLEPRVSGPWMVLGAQVAASSVRADEYVADGRSDGYGAGEGGTGRG